MVARIYGDLVRMRMTWKILGDMGATYPLYKGREYGGFGLGLV